MQQDYALQAATPIPGARVGILQAAWHREHTDNMVKVCREILEQAGCQAIDLYNVPGCYELPLAAKTLAARGEYDALVVFGAILKGETDHYQVILETCITGFGRVMYDYEVPIVMEILPVHELQHLIARTQGQHNKGIEAALAAADVITFYRAIGARPR